MLPLKFHQLRIRSGNTHTHRVVVCTATESSVQRQRWTTSRRRLPRTNRVANGRRLMMCVCGLRHTESEYALTHTDDRAHPWRVLHTFTLHTHQQLFCLHNKLVVPRTTILWARRWKCVHPSKKPTNVPSQRFDARAMTATGWGRGSRRCVVQVNKLITRRISRVARSVQRTIYHTPHEHDACDLRPYFVCVCGTGPIPSKPRPGE